MVHDLSNIVLPVMFLWLGIKSFFNGFNRLKKKRALENTPTSTVRGLAMGLVELTGKAEKTKPLQSPFTRFDCVYYRYSIEQYRNSGKSGHWVVIAKGDSTSCPFWLDDGTGTIMVLPQGAELIMPVDYEFETGLGRTLPGNLANFMMRNSLKYEGLFGTYQLRFKEWFVAPGETVYVLGTAKKVSDPFNEHKKKLIQRLDEIQHNPQKMREADVDHDGDISSEEWDAVVKKVEQSLLEEELKADARDHVMDTVIGLEKGQVFIISDESQTQLVTKLSRKVLLNVFGGATLSLVMLVYMLFLLKPWIGF